MTIDIEKLADEYGYMQDSDDCYVFSFEALKQFAEAYAAKVLEDKEREIARLDKQIIEMQAYEMSMQNRANDDAKEITELQVYINDLREALEEIRNDSFVDSWQCKLAEQALSKTPAQSLQEHDNEVIEMVASAWTCDCDDCPDKIRALKGEV